MHYSEITNKKCCGLWLVLVGTVLGISILFGGSFFINPFLFLAGYYISFYIANINGKIRKRLSKGSASPFQIKMIFRSIALLFVLMFCIAGPFIPQMNFRMIWLGVPVILFFIADAILKFGFGFWMLFFSKPTTNAKTTF